MSAGRRPVYIRRRRGRGRAPCRDRSPAQERTIDSGSIIKTLWLVWAVYWMAAALGGRRVQRREPVFERLAHVALMGAGFICFTSSSPRFAGLNGRFLPGGAVLQAVAVALTALGLGLAVLARLYLGRNWSAEVVIREGHRLIRTGPYARVRHPIYTGLLVALLGAVLAVGELRAALGFTILTLGFYLKARREEQFLASEFGEEFERHKRETGLFLPRITRLPS